MNRFEPGFPGKDTMREKAEKMFRIADGKSSSSFKNSRETVHKMSKEQSDMVLPKLVKKTTQQTVRLPFKKGGHASMPKGSKKVEEVKKMMMKEGKAKGKMMGGCMKYAKGGSVYERDMVGEKPHSKMPHINYESDMKGEKIVRKRMAIGGAGKERKGYSSPKKKSSPACM